METWESQVEVNYVLESHISLLKFDKGIGKIGWTKPLLYELAFRKN